MSSLNQQLLANVEARSNIAALDAIRGVSAVAVVVAHTLGPRQLGSMAVAVFFVLSGFLITWLLVKESDNTGRVSLRNFYIRRALRIFPAFYVFWIICIGAAALRGTQIPWGLAGAAFFYIGDYYQSFHYVRHDIMGNIWSLGVEEKFYLIWPFVFESLHRNPAKLLKLASSVIAAIWLYRVIMTTTLSLPPNYLRYAFEARFDNILFGCVLALGFRLGKLDPILRLVARVSLLPVVIGALLLGLVFLENRLGPTYHYVLGMSLDSTLIAVMLIQFVYLAAMRGWTWLDHPILKFFGRISYSLYLYHVVVLHSIHHYVPHLRPRWADLLIAAGSLAAAYCSYRVIEKPFLQLKGRFALGNSRRERPLPESQSPLVAGHPDR